MAKNGTRLTLVMDKDIEKALRKKQAKMLMNAERGVSFSLVVNQELRKSLKL